MQRFSNEELSLLTNKEVINEEILDKVTILICELFGYNYDEQKLITTSRYVMEVKYIIWHLYKKKLGYSTRTLSAHFGKTVKSINESVRLIQQRYDNDDLLENKRKILWEIL